MKLLEYMGVKTFFLGKETTEAELKTADGEFKPVLAAGKEQQLLRQFTLDNLWDGLEALTSVALLLAFIRDFRGI